MWRNLLVVLVALPAVLSACTQYPVIKQLKLKDIEGMWFGQYTLKRTTPEDTKCQRLHFYIRDDGKGVELTESVLPKRGTTTKGTSFYATGTQAGNDGRLAVTGKMDGVTYNFQYSIIATDFKNFMVTAMCIQGAESAWIMTRKANSISADQMAEIKAALKANNLSLDKFESTPQNKCH